MISKLKMVNCRYMNVVKNIREIRLQKSISQSAIADELGVDVAAVSYTHLDVYKRQEPFSGTLIQFHP